MWTFDSNPYYNFILLDFIKYEANTNLQNISCRSYFPNLLNLLVIVSFICLVSLVSLLNCQVGYTVFNKSSYIWVGNWFPRLVQIESLPSSRMVNLLTYCRTRLIQTRLILYLFGWLKCKHLEPQLPRSHIASTLSFPFRIIISYFVHWIWHSEYVISNFEQFNTPAPFH